MGSAPARAQLGRSARAAADVRHPRVRRRLCWLDRGSRGRSSLCWRRRKCKWCLSSLTAGRVGL
ncbi:hypothetical protein BD626DRAFT_472505 [Schizophyllum amplum]|uniref:Uncharacterized protein n=1 Tax=Schizophyllum amplum TaxID=97359 RepID=A0A550CW01_9AGAR|nr:hypothetical protein BD626DRAFT_472505 [Auriculariopsis ampla]